MTSRHFPNPSLLRGLFLAATLSLLLASSVLAAPEAPSLEELQTPPETAVKRPSGLVTQVLEEGSGASPDANDIVVVHFTAYRPDGQVFQDTREKGKPASMPLDRVFEGWREGMQLMKVGETRRLWVPAELGPPNPGKGRPRSAVFDVELVDVLPLPDPPKYLQAPDPAATKVDSGAHYLVIDEGTGDEAADAKSRILTHYLLWNDQGVLLDSSYARGRPTAFMLDRTMGAFSEAVQGMKVGERRRLWIPQFAHQGQWPNAPDGTMIFEVEMVQLLPDHVLQPQDQPGGGR